MSESTNLTPSARRDAALASWAAFTATPATSDAATTGAAFQNAVKGRELLDNAYNASVAAIMSAPDALADPAALAIALGALATARDAIAATFPTTAPRATSTAPADPAAIRAAAIERLGLVRSVRAELVAALEWTDALVAAAEQPFDGDAATSAEEDATMAATTCPEKISGWLAHVGTALNRAPRAAGSPRAAGTPRPTSERYVVGAVFAHGDYRLTIGPAAEENGKLAYVVTGADGTAIGTATSASGAALLVNGGTSVSGNAYWHDIPAA